MNRAFDRSLHVRVVKHNEWRISPEFEAQLHDLVGRLPHEQPSHLGRTSESQLADFRILADFGAERCGVANGDNTEQPRGNAGLFGQDAQSDSRERGQVGRLEDHRATRRKCRRDLAHRHSAREIPGRNAADDADGLTDHEQSLVLLVTGNDVSIQALCFLRIPLCIGGAIEDLSLRLIERLAHLRDQDRREIVEISDQEIVVSAKDQATLFSGY